jgi:hypothetical protein
MSMKRTKEVGPRSSSRPGQPGFWEKKVPERVYRWEDDVAPKADEEFLAYSPASKFERDALVLHAKFGKGIVTFVNGPKLDILFQDGPKKLAHNPTGAPPSRPTSSV